MADKTSAEVEATDGEKTYEFDGVTYVLNPELDVVGLLEHYDDGHITKAAKELVGEEVYAKLRKAGKLKTMEQLNELVGAASKAFGSELGE
jgi:hypothetical protein